MEIEVAEPGLANAHCIGQHGLEHRLQLTGRAANDLQHLGSRGLLLERLGKVLACLGQLPSRFGELPNVCVEFLFQFGPRLVRPADVRSRLRSGRTKLAAACWALCAFERQGSPRRHSHWSPVGPAKDRAYQS